jgi:hypothetical protein
MKQHRCPICRELIFFEHGQCGHCGADLAFDSGEMRFRPLDAAAPCANRALIECNWAARPGDAFCPSCALTRTIPALGLPRNVLLWRRVEQAKRRLVYDLYRLELPLRDDQGQGVAFDILSDESAGHPIMTGHLNGLITLSLAEADDVERETRRTAFGEPYRTLLGHFRHEVGHFYWSLLVEQTRLQKPFRLIFGDEREDYATRLQEYHDRSDRSYDRTGFISAYAASHPWEDWAETFAHFLHIISTLDSAAALPLALDERSRQTLNDPYVEHDFAALLASWTPVACAMNELNRSMGLGDAYPFDLPAAVRGKLHFVHMAILQWREGRRVNEIWCGRRDSNPHDVAIEGF